MYLHLSETTIKTILGTILKNQSKIFPYIQLLAYLQLIFTSAINLFKNIPIRIFRFWPCSCIFRVIPNLP